LKNEIIDDTTETIPLALKQKKLLLIEAYETTGYPTEVAKEKLLDIEG